MNFEKLGISKKQVAALLQKQIETPTEIQEKTIPLILEGKDVVGISKTGSGKTLAFGLPLLERIEKGSGIQAIILGPTRELTEQIKKEIISAGKPDAPSILTIYGGVSFEPQIMGMKRADIVVGTPGRVLDHLRRGNLDLSKVEYVVLDEADKMEQMGFIEDVRQILSYTPKKRHTCLFGATISEEVRYLQTHEMQDPVTIRVERHVGEEYLDQYYHDVPDNQKFSALVYLLKNPKLDRCIVFCATRKTADLIAENLRRNEIPAAELHGGMTQPRRLRTIDNFHRGKPTILVATDVAARGLDIKDVSHVINFDVPRDPEDYVHRVGRTARAGHSGAAHTILASRDYEPFRAILHRFPELKITREDLKNIPRMPFDPHLGRRNDRRSGSGGNGRYERRPQNRSRRGPPTQRAHTHRGRNDDLPDSQRYNGL